MTASGAPISTAVPTGPKPETSSLATRGTYPGSRSKTASTPTVNAGTSSGHVARLGFAEREPWNATTPATVPTTASATTSQLGVTERSKSR